MATKELRRQYHMYDAELTAFAFGLIANITRDITEFTARGITSVQTDALDALASAFEAFYDDEYYRAQVSLAVQTKNNLRMGMEVKTRDIVQCAAIKWGEGSPQYNMFSAKNISSESDKSFITTARQVVSVGTDFLSDLTAVGLSQAMLDDLEDDADSFHDALIAIQSAEGIRDSKTQERIKKGNEIYELVAKYCKIGKIIWDDVDETKYNDYVIYPKVEHQLSKPQNLAAVYDPMNPPDITLSWDSVIDAISYDVYYNIANTGAPSGEFNLLNNYAASPAAIPSIIGKRNYFKIKAKNADNKSDYSDEAYVDVPVA